MAAWSAGCTLFHSHNAPAPPPKTRQTPQAAPVERLPPMTIRSAPASISKRSRPRLNPPQPQAPAPLVTLGNGNDAKADAQRLLEQATLKLARINRAELPENAASTYQQANGLISAAQRAMADQDYVAASSLAEKASALINQLPPQE
jgi:hypothetical protein